MKKIDYGTSYISPNLKNKNKTIKPFMKGNGKYLWFVFFKENFMREYAHILWFQGFKKQIGFDIYFSREFK